MRAVLQGNLWLVDGGSEYVAHVLRRRFAIACGPARGVHPGLAIAVPSGTALPATEDLMEGVELCHGAGVADAVADE